jgi:hypothetical protein
MAIQRADAQTSTLAKLTPPHTAAHNLGQPPFVVFKPSAMLLEAGFISRTATD